MSGADQGDDHLGASHLGDRVSALLDGELAAAQVEAARRHLAACPACAAELAEIGTARSRVRALPAVEPPAGSLEAAVAAVAARSPASDSAAEEPSARVVPFRRRRLGVGLGALAATAAASIALLGFLSPPDDPPAAPRMAQLIQAHATAEAGTDPVSQLAPTAVPVTFRP